MHIAEQTNWSQESGFIFIELSPAAAFVIPRV